MIKYLSLCATLLLFSVPLSVANGAIVYNLGFEHVSYSVNVGESLDVNVYLFETLTEASDNSLLLAAPLLTAVVQTQIAGSGSAMFAGLGSGGSGFLNTSIFNDTLDLVGEDSGNFVNSPTNTVRRVQLGSFNISAASVGSNELSFLSASDFLTSNLADITPNLAAAVPAVAAGFINTSATITAVPEPSSGMLLGGVVAASIAFRRRRVSSRS